MKKLFILAMVLIGFTAVSFGQPSTVGSADAKATVTVGHNIGAGTMLKFGSFSLTGTAGSIVVNTAGVAVNVTNATTPAAAGVGASLFKITGIPNEVFTVMPITSITLTNSAGVSSDDRSMTLDNFTTSWDNTITMLTGGSYNLLVGAKLNFDGKEIAGDYTGTYSVTVNWP